MKLPSFDSLPLRKDGPAGNAWGLFGDNDQMGRLNLITPETVKAAASSEIKEGTRVSLDWPLDTPKLSNIRSRKQFEHKILQLADHHANDDEININTQSGTQWDGLRHYGSSLHVQIGINR